MDIKIYCIILQNWSTSCGKFITIIMFSEFRAIICQFDPSPEEKVIIHRLEVAFSRALGDALLYDVLDELDNISTSSPRPKPDPTTATVPLPKVTHPPSTTLKPTGSPGLTQISASVTCS